MDPSSLPMASNAAEPERFAHPFLLSSWSMMFNRLVLRVALIFIQIYLFITSGNHIGGIDRPSQKS